MTELTYRKATIDDLSRLIALEQLLIDSERPYYQFIKTGSITYYDMEELITDTDTNLMVAVFDAQIIGSGYAQVRPARVFHTHDELCYLGFIYVDPEHRGRGVGRGIVDELLDWGKKQGLKHFQLDVYSVNESAVRLYEKAGFNKVTVKMELSV